MAKLTDEELQKLSNTKHKVEEDSAQLQAIVDDIVKPYVEDLDKYIAFVRDVLKDGENPPTAQELDDFCMNISVFIYYASGMQEQLGIKDDISKAIYREMYNTVRDNQTSGTVADKDTIAELSSQTEYLTSVLYKRAYSIVKAKVAAAQEILSSVKKVISRRIQEAEITRIARQ
jgi:hypothetical protein